MTILVDLLGMMIARDNHIGIVVGKEIRRGAAVSSLAHDA